MDNWLDAQRIDIYKVAEDQRSVDYLFCCGLWVRDERQKYRQRQTNFGRVKIFRASGEVKIVYPMPDDNGRRAAATAYKLKSHWQNGELPQKTQYASG